MDGKKFNKLAKVSKSRKMGKIMVDEDVMGQDPLKGYPFQKKFSVEQSFRNMVETSNLNLSEDDGEGGRTDGLKKSPSEMTPKQRKEKADHDKAKRDRDARKKARVAQMQKNKAHADTPAEKERKRKEREKNLKTFGGQGRETFRDRMKRTGGSQTESNEFEEVIHEEVPESLKNQIKQVQAKLAFARKVKSSAYQRGDGRSSQQRYQKKVWDWEDKLEALRDKEDRLRNEETESNEFNTYRNMIDMWEENLQEATIVYKVKGIQKPETEKFQSSAKLMKLKVSFKKKGSDTLVTMTGNKKQLRDFDSVARGKSSYGDPSSVQHFDEK